MGEIELTEQYVRIIDRSHQPDYENMVDTNTYYAAGWFVNTDNGEIYHSGGTPNYSSKIIIRPVENSGLCVLTNMNASSNTINIARNILNILDGKPQAAYQPDIWRIFDTIFSTITLVSITALILIIISILRTIRRTGKIKLPEKMLTRNRIPAFIIPGVLMLLTIITIIIMPITFNSSWLGLLPWAPTSLVMGIVFFACLSLSSFFLAVARINHKITVEEKRSEK